MRKRRKKITFVLEAWNIENSLPLDDDIESILIHNFVDDYGQTHRVKGLTIKEVK